MNESRIPNLNRLKKDELYELFFEQMSSFDFTGLSPSSTLLSLLARSTQKMLEQTKGVLPAITPELPLELRLIYINRLLRELDEALLIITPNESKYQITEIKSGAECRIRYSLNVVIDKYTESSRQIMIGKLLKQSDEELWPRVKEFFSEVFKLQVNAISSLSIKVDPKRRRGSEVLESITLIYDLVLKDITETKRVEIDRLLAEAGERGGLFRIGYELTSNIPAILKQINSLIAANPYYSFSFPYQNSKAYIDLLDRYFSQDEDYGIPIYQLLGVTSMENEEWGEEAVDIDLEGDLYACDVLFRLELDTISKEYFFSPLDLGSVVPALESPQKTIWGEEKEKEQLFRITAAAGMLQYSYRQLLLNQLLSIEPEKQGLRTRLFGLQAMTGFQSGVYYSDIPTEFEEVRAALEKICGLTMLSVLLKYRTMELVSFKDIIALDCREDTENNILSIESLYVSSGVAEQIARQEPIFDWRNIPQLQQEIYPFLKGNGANQLLQLTGRLFDIRKDYIYADVRTLSKNLTTINSTAGLIELALELHKQGLPQSKEWQRATLRLLEQDGSNLFSLLRRMDSLNSLAESYAQEGFDELRLSLKESPGIHFKRLLAKTGSITRLQIFVYDSQIAEVAPKGLKFPEDLDPKVWTFLEKPSKPLLGDEEPSSASLLEAIRLFSDIKRVFDWVYTTQFIPITDEFRRASKGETEWIRSPKSLMLASYENAEPLLELCRLGAPTSSEEELNGFLRFFELIHLTMRPRTTNDSLIKQIHEMGFSSSAGDLEQKAKQLNSSLELGLKTFLRTAMTPGASFADSFKACIKLEEVLSAGRAEPELLYALSICSSKGVVPTLGVGASIPVGDSLKYVLNSYTLQLHPIPEAQGTDFMRPFERVLCSIKTVGPAQRALKNNFERQVLLRSFEADTTAYPAFTISDPRLPANKLTENKGNELDVTYRLTENIDYLQSDEVVELLLAAVLQAGLSRLLFESSELFNSYIGLLEELWSGMRALKTSPQAPLPSAIAERKALLIKRVELKTGETEPLGRLPFFNMGLLELLEICKDFCLVRATETNNGRVPEGMSTALEKS